MNRFFCAMLAAALLLCGCGASGDPPAASSPATSSQMPAPPVETPPPALVIDTEKDTVEQILSEMTLPEKVGQLFFVRCPAEAPQSHRASYRLSGYSLL